MKRKLSYILRTSGGYQEVGPVIKSVHVNDAAHMLGLVLTVKERDDPASPKTRYYAKFEGVEVVEGSCRVGVYGDGRTPRAAILDYIRQVSGKPCVTGGYSNPHRFTMPNLHI